MIKQWGRLLYTGLSEKTALRQYICEFLVRGERWKAFYTMQYLITHSLTIYSKGSKHSVFAR